MKKFLLLFVAMIAMVGSYAAIRTAATGSVTWTTSASNTAFLAVTTTADSIIIPSGSNVTVSSTGVTCGAIIVQTGGTLTFQSSSNRNVIVTSGGGYNGTVTINGTVVFANSSSQFITYNGPSFTVASGATWTLAGSSADDGGIHYTGTTTSTLTTNGKTVGPLQITGAGGNLIQADNISLSSANSATFLVTLSTSTSNYTINSGATCTFITGSTPTSFTSGSKILISGTLINQSATTMTLTGTGAVTINSGGTYVHNTAASASTPLGLMTQNTGSTFIYRGSSTLTPSVSVSGRTFYNLSFESTSGSWSTFGGVSGAGILSILNDFSVGGAGAGTVSMALTGFTGTITVARNLAISTGSALNLTTGNATINIAGNWSDLGSFTPGSSGIVNVNGTSAQSIAKTGGESFRTLNITNTSGIVTLSNGASVAGVTTINANAVLATSATLTGTGGVSVNGSFQLNTGGFATGTFTYSSGTLIYNSSSAYGTAGTHSYWPAASGPTNVTILQGGLDLGNGSIASRTVTGVFQTAAGVTLSNSSVLTLNGTVRINTGGFFNNSPTYGAASTLIYNTGATFTRGAEWTTATSGAGYPNNVQISNPGTVTTVNMGSTSAQNAGSLTIDASTVLNTTSAVLTVLGNVAINGTISLGGDVKTAGNWTVAAAATQTNNSKAVFFIAATGTQTLTKTGGSGLFFDYLVIDKATSGSATLAPGTNVTINSTAGGVLQINNAGSLDLNGNTLTLNNAGGYILVTGAGVRTITSGIPGGLVDITAAKSVVSASGGTLSFGANVTVATAAALDFGASLTTINGTFKINTGGSASTNGPIYAGTATLLYNTGNYTTSLEWGAGTSVGAGVPFNVTLTLASGANAVTLAGNRNAVGTLALTTGSVTIGSNILTAAAVTRTSGTLTGSNTSSLVLTGTGSSLGFTTGSTNNFLKALTLNTGATATLANALNITGYDGTSSEGVLTVTGSAVLTTGGFLTLKSNTNGTARIAQGNTAGGYISGAATVERFIPQNSVKSWRLLATNTSSSQTINSAWQEGQVGYNVNTNPGFGTMIAANGASLSAVQLLGFDTLSYGGSIFKYDPATDNLVGIANTNSTVLSSEVGYFLFIRGDRGPNQFNTGVGSTPTAPTSSTVLRSTGTLFQGNQSAIATGAKNYALLRNPYASRIDLRQVIRTGTLINAYQVWDPTLSNAAGFGAYQTLTYNGVSGNYENSTTSAAYGTAGTSHNFVESGSAFYIQSTSAASGSAQVVEAAKGTGSAVVNRPAAASNRLYYSLSANNPTGADVVDGGYIDFDASYSNDVDIEDIRKSSNFGENFGLINSATSLVVERRALLTVTDTLRFDMNSMRNITYTLDINPAAISALNLNAILEDKFLGTATSISLLSPSQYSFTVNTTAGSFAADRFRIVFRPQSPLPVSITNIRAMAQAGNVAVEWKVANQLNVSRYEIERSANGTSFTKIGTQQSTGLNGAEVTYNFLDLNSTRGTNYYRIKIIDINGQSRYSAIAIINFGNVKPSVKVSPNPVEAGNLNIVFTAQEKGAYQIRLVNNIGQVMMNRTAVHPGGDATQTFTLPSMLAAGLYQLEVITPNSDRQVQKVIIK